MEEINADMVRRAINEPDPVLEALSLLLKSVAADAVEILSSTLTMIGHDPTQLPAEFFVQAIMIESEKVFKNISREKWIDIYDSYQQVKGLVDGDPALRAEIQASKDTLPQRLRQAKHQQAMAQPEPTSRAGYAPSVNDLLDGNF